MLCLFAIFFIWNVQSFKTSLSKCGWIHAITMTSHYPQTAHGDVMLWDCFPNCQSLCGGRSSLKGLGIRRFNVYFVEHLNNLLNKIIWLGTSLHLNTWCISKTVETNSIGNALELLQPCTRPSIYIYVYIYIYIYIYIYMCVCVCVCVQAAVLLKTTYSLLAPC